MSYKRSTPHIWIQVDHWFLASASMALTTAWEALSFGVTENENRESEGWFASGKGPYPGCEQITC